MSALDGLAILVLFAVAFGLVPVAFIVLGWLHLRESRRHPERMDAYGWVLMLAPPALIVAGFFASAYSEPSGTVEDQGSGPSNSSLDLNPFQVLWIAAWFGQLGVGWLISLAAIIPAYRARARLAAQRSGAIPVAGQYAVAAPGGGSVAATEPPSSGERLAPSAAAPLGAKRGRAPGPIAVVVIGAVSALIGLLPFASRVPQPGGSDDAAGPLLLLPFAPDLGISLQISYGVILSGAGLAAIALRFARARYPAIGVRVALWGVIGVQSAAVLHAVIVPTSELATTGEKVIGVLAWMALGAWVFHLIALGSRATALIGLAFVAVAATWSILSWPLSGLIPFGTLYAFPDQLLVPGPLLGGAIAWAGFDTVRKVRATAAAIGINWVLCTALAALTPQPEWGLEMEPPRSWGGEFVAILLTPTTLFFTIAVPMAVAAVGVAYRQSTRQ